VRNVARLLGILWIAANLANLWKLLSAIVSIQNPYERVGYVGLGLIVVPLVFYCALQVVALTTRTVRCLKILLAISFLSVLARGIIPLELGAWIILVLVPSKVLMSALLQK
jgi:hypothetical protein